MSSPEEFGSVVAILASHLSADTDVSALEMTRIDGRWRLTLRTSTPGRVIGRRGATADALRTALAGHLDDPRLQLNIEEERPPEDPGPPPAGGREPRPPAPTGPQASVEAAEPGH